MTDAKTEAAMRAWYVGLHCRKCGQPVKQADGGIFWKPLNRDPEAECKQCREGKNQP